MLTILGCVSHVCLSSYTSDSAVGEWFFSSGFNDTNLSHKLPIELELSVVTTTSFEFMYIMKIYILDNI